MSGDYETLEINQPKISYFKKRSEKNTEWLDELINKIEDMKNKISDDDQSWNYFQVKKKALAGLGDGDSYHGKLNRNKQPHLK